MARYLPGQEPDKLQKEIKNLKRNLDAAYPDGVIISLHSSNKELGKKVTKLYRELGYDDGASFLEAYGYKLETQKKGRPGEDLNEIIEELKSRYAGGATCTSVDELKAENPDLAPKFKSMQNRAKDLFGMPFMKYLKQNGILIVKERPVKEISEKTEKLTPEENLNALTAEVQKRYAGKILPTSLKQLKEENPDLTLSSLSVLTGRVYGETVLEYLKRVGLIRMETPEEKARKNKVMREKRNQNLTSDRIIEKKCYRKYSPEEFQKYLKKLKIDLSLFAGIHYKGSAKAAPDFIVQCAVIPYMQSLKKPPSRISIYENELIGFKKIALADQAADILEPEEFQVFLDKLIGDGLPDAAQTLIPYCRFASNAQLLQLLNRYESWDDWSEFKRRGRCAMKLVDSAMMLSRERAAAVHAERIEKLYDYAEEQEMSVDNLMDTTLYDIEFSMDGKQSFQLGNTVLSLILNDDLSVSMMNEKTGNIVKSIPKGGLDSDTYKAKSKEIKAALYRINEGVERYCNHLNRKIHYRKRRSRSFEEWSKVYFHHYILKKIAEYFVWAVKDVNTEKLYGVMLRPDGFFINADGEPVQLSLNARIDIANVLDLGVDEVEKWKKYLRSQKIEQPVLQMLEKIYVFEEVQWENNLYINSDDVIRNLIVMGYKEEIFDGDDDKGLRWSIFETEELILHVLIQFYYENHEKFEIYRFVNDDYYEIKAKKMTRLLNYILHQNDMETLESYVHNNNMEMIEKLGESITEDIIDLLIIFAKTTIKFWQECGWGTADEVSLALEWLINYKHTHFDD